MLPLFQLLFVLFSLFAVASVIRRKRDGQLGPKGAVFWITFWCLVAVVVVWPNTTSVLAARFGIGRGADFVLYIALAIIFFVLFKLHIKIEAIGRDVTKVVRRESLEQESKKARKQES